MPSGSNTCDLHRLVVGGAELHVGIEHVAGGESGGAGHRVRVLEQLAELARRLHRRERRRARASGVTPLYSNSHSRSWRGSPVQAQISCRTLTWRVVSASPSLNDGRRLVTGVSHVSCPSATSLASSSVVSAFVFDAIMKSVFAVDRRRLAELAHAEAAGEDDLAVLDDPEPDARDAELLAPGLDELHELGQARLVEPVRLLAREGSRARSPSAGAGRRPARPVRRASRRPPGSCRRSRPSSCRPRSARTPRRPASRWARSGTRRRAVSTSRSLSGRSLDTLSGHCASGL